MTNKYEVSMLVTGETVNEVASKLMVAAYTQDYEIEELYVEEVKKSPELLQEQEDSPEAFRFPHVKELLEYLNGSSDAD